MRLRLRWRRNLQAEVHAALQAQLGCTALWSGDASRPLGEILVAGRRIIDKRDLEQALTVQKRTRQKLGQILLDQGKVTHRDLFSALSQQRSLRDPWRRI